MASVFFTKDAVNISGTTFKATRYTIDAAGAVVIDIELNGRKFEPVKIPAGRPEWKAAARFVDAAETIDAEPIDAASAADPAGNDAAGTIPAADPAGPAAAADDDFLTISDTDAEKTDAEFLYDIAEDAAPAPKKARKDRERKPAALDPAKAARGPVPEKDFIGTEITGRGWRILFDGEENRTRVIFDKVPTKEVRQIVKDAGFYWSPAMGSWNKKLTFKAYRAALDLAKALQDVRRIAA